LLQGSVRSVVVAPPLCVYATVPDGWPKNSGNKHGASPTPVASGPVAYTPCALLCFALSRRHADLCEDIDRQACSQRAFCASGGKQIFVKTLRRGQEVLLQGSRDTFGTLPRHVQLQSVDTFCCSLVVACKSYMKTLTDKRHPSLAASSEQTAGHFLAFSCG
jgi:hypothetical protein